MTARRLTPKITPLAKISRNSTLRLLAGGFLLGPPRCGGVRGLERAAYPLGPRKSRCTYRAVTLAFALRCLTVGVIGSAPRESAQHHEAHQAMSHPRRLL
jgi:hypothetical protein